MHVFCSWLCILSRRPATNYCNALSITSSHFFRLLGFGRERDSREEAGWLKATHSPSASNFPFTGQPAQQGLIASGVHLCCHVPSLPGCPLPPVPIPNCPTTLTGLFGVPGWVWHVPLVIFAIGSVTCDGVVTFVLSQGHLWNWIDRSTLVNGPSDWAIDQPGSPLPNQDLNVESSYLSASSAGQWFHSTRVNALHLRYVMYSENLFLG